MSLAPCLRAVRKSQTPVLSWRERPGSMYERACEGLVHGLYLSNALETSIRNSHVCVSAASVVYMLYSASSYSSASFLTFM